MTLADPDSPLRGTVTLAAAATDLGSGVARVRFHAARAGSGSWTQLCDDTNLPYTCTFDSTTLADGAWDMRAVATDSDGNAASSVVAGRTVDNSAPRGADVQATDKTGGQAGKLEPGDWLTLTWSEDVKPSTLVPGWDGSGSAAVTVAVHGAGGDDTLDFAGTAPGLGTLALHGNYVNAGKTVTFQATASLAASTTVTITLGAQSGSGSLRTWTTPTAMEWAPSSAATDLAGNPCSTATITETGGADKDF